MVLRYTTTTSNNNKNDGLDFYRAFLDNQSALHVIQHSFTPLHTSHTGPSVASAALGQTNGYVAANLHQHLAQGHNSRMTVFEWGANCQPSGYWSTH